MSVTASAYTAGIKSFVDHEFAWGGGSFKALLLKNTYTLNQNSHVFVADVVSGSTEVTGGSYARVALTSVTDTAGTNLVNLLAADITFAAMTGTGIRYMVVYQDSGSDATSKVICCVNFGTDIAPTAQTVTFNLSTAGLVVFNVV